MSPEQVKFRKNVLAWIIGFLAIILLIAVMVSLTDERIDLDAVNGSAETGDETAVLVTNVDGPFTVTYLGNNEQNGAFIMSISTSSSQGREKAMDWMRQNGYNPTEVDLRFDDYVNPMLEGVAD